MIARVVVAGSPAVTSPAGTPNFREATEDDHNRYRKPAMRASRLGQATVER
jgi:hypothetical protein